MLMKKPEDSKNKNGGQKNMVPGGKKDANYQNHRG
jgi:hypothetical protein